MQTKPPAMRKRVVMELPVPLEGKTKDDVATADATEKYILDQLGKDPDFGDYNKQLWKNRAYEVLEGQKDVAFPEFDPNDQNQLKAAVDALKDKLKEKADHAGGKLDLRLRDTFYKTGMIFRRPDEATGNTADHLTKGEIDKSIKDDLMKPYYQRAVDGDPIPHDTDHLGQDFWLPGLFVIDEIFQALFNATWNKCVAFNNDLAQGKKNTDLENFVNGISTGQKGIQEDADKYIPFINYTGGAKDKTYIKLIFSQDNYIVGGLIHVADWASGTHSNGTGYP
jgi:hypothetical protein